MNAPSLAAGIAGRSFVVTGAGGAIGSAITGALAATGAKVLATDMPGRKPPESPNVTFTECDLRDLASHDGLFAQAAELAPLAGLVHTAAVIRRLPIDEITEADFDLQMNVNLKASFFLNRAAWRQLRGSGGAIVNYVSQSWMTGGLQSSVAYAASKGALVSMTRGLARTWAPDNVRVNAVSPGFVDTDMMREGVDAQALAALLAGVPMGRMAQPDEMVGATVFLLSDLSAYITGAVLNVSGGQLMY